MGGGRRSFFPMGTADVEEPTKFSRRKDNLDLVEVRTLFFMLPLPKTELHDPTLAFSLTFEPLPSESCPFLTSEARFGGVGGRSKRQRLGAGNRSCDQFHSIQESVRSELLTPPLAPI